MNVPLRNSFDRAQIAAREGADNGTPARTGSAMEELLPYFERELQLLRRYAAEFANRFPLVAGRLQAASDDPHAERVLQGVALLSARVAKRLDDGHPQCTEALLESMYPRAREYLSSTA